MLSLQNIVYAIAIAYAAFFFIIHYVMFLRHTYIDIFTPLHEI